MDGKAPLQSIVNFRDVGIATGGSAALPAGRLYRCYNTDTEAVLPHNNCEVTKKQSRPVIVRSKDTLEMEVQHKDRIRGFSVLDINVHEISLESQSFKDSVSDMVPWTDKLQFLGRGKEYRKTMQGSFDRNLDWRKTATNLLDLSKRQIQAIFLALAQQDACPVLIYGPCTGLVLCLILHLLDIPEEKIVHEYLLTRQHEAAMLEQVNARRREIGLEEKASLNLEPTYVRHVLGHLETKYRGIDAYLESAGLTAQQLDDLKANLRGRDVRSSEKLVDVEEREVS
ncbi:hypothetical protein D0868_07650 [Hortaea werneckii]|nr:hypothetical protein D0868_07650 [Hortaea werneckii]RMY37800.1 hypothetical protein D0866_03034 [Hortaea werneckii]